jgi:hypothetical protein
MQSPQPILSPQNIPPRLRFEGHAIVSADGMIATADGTMPAPLRNEADFRQFQRALDRAMVVVLGRLAHRRHANPGRRRLVFTSRVAGFAPDPDDPLATLFNPAGAGFAEVLAALGIADGTVAVTGGTRVFDAFLPLYHRFALAECNGLALPGGIPCFAGGHSRTVLASAGLRPKQFEMIDAAAGVSLTTWET